MLLLMSFQASKHCRQQTSRIATVHKVEMMPNFDPRPMTLAIVIVIVLWPVPSCFNKY